MRWLRLGLAILICLGFLIAILALTYAAPVQAAQRLELLAHLPPTGQAQAVAVQGSYAYVGVGSELAVLDISDPTQPRSRGLLPMGMDLRTLYVSGSTLYAIGREAESKWPLSILDISNPAAPRELTRYGSDRFPSSLAVEGNYLYLGLFQGLEILDISNPAAPSLVGYYPVGERGVHSIALADGYAYLLTSSWDRSSRLEIVDVSTPQLPQKLFSSWTVFWAQEIVATAGHAYISSLADNSRWTTTYLTILDVSEPSAPRRLDTFLVDGGTFNGIFLALSAPYLYVTTYAHALIVFDLSTPAAPLEQTQVAGGGSDLSVANGLTYLVSYGSGFHVVDPFAAEGAAKIGAYHFLTRAVDVATSGRYAYVASRYEGGVRVIDFQNPHTPIAAVTYPQANHVALDGTSLYIVTGGCGLGGCWGVFERLSIVEPLRPTDWGLYQVYRGADTSFSGQVVVSGSLAYLATDWYGLQLVDLTDSSPEPREINFLGTHFYDVAAHEQYAYVTAGREGFYIFDVSLPPTPTLASVYPTNVTKVEIAGEFAFVAGGGNEELTVLNLANPTAPVSVHRYTAAGVIRDIALDGQFAYLALDNGVEVVDILQPTSLVQVARNTAVGAAREIAAAYGRVYVVSAEGALSLLLHHAPWPHSLLLPLVSR